MRCTHLVLGFILFGVIYYLGMFTNRVIRGMDKKMRKEIVPKILPGYFHWLKWEAVWTVLSGFALLFWKFAVLRQPFILLSRYTFCLSIGVCITLFITVSIWFVILPLQDRILELTEEGRWTEELDEIVWRSRKFSHLSSTLGILVVIMMVAANYLPI
ncbi:MAG: hypothetical protein AAF518_16940 [Spirochaetota bacterium]